jgi:hypothetical protein
VLLITARCSGCGETKEMGISLSHNSGPNLCGECQKKAEEKRIQDYADSLAVRMRDQFNKSLDKNGMIDCIARVMSEEILSLRGALSFHSDGRLG